MYHEEWVNVRDRLGFKAPTDPHLRPSREKSILEGFSWVPPGLPSHKVGVNIQRIRPQTVTRFWHGWFLSCIISVLLSYQSVFIAANMIKRISIVPAIQRLRSVYFPVFLSVLVLSIHPSRSLCITSYEVDLVSCSWQEYW